MHPLPATDLGGAQSTPNRRWILLLLFFMAVLPVFKFSAGLGYDDKSGYLASAAVMDLRNLGRYQQVMQRRPELAERCLGDRRCVLRIDGRLASLFNYPIQSTLILLVKKLLKPFTLPCQAASISVFVAFLLQAALLAGAWVWMIRKSKETEFEVSVALLLAAILALYVFGRDINFTVLNGKASGAVGLLAVFTSAAFYLGRSRAFLLGLWLLPLIHLGQAVFISFFFLAVSALSYLWGDRSRSSLGGAAAGLVGFVVSLLFCSFAMSVTTSGGFSALDILRGLLGMTLTHVVQESSWSRLGGLVLSSLVLSLALFTSRGRKLARESAQSRYWILVAVAVVFLWGVFVFHLAISSVAKLQGAELATSELYDRVLGNLEFLPLSLLLLGVLHGIRYGLTRWNLGRPRLALVLLLTLLGILSLPALLRFSRHIPLAWISNRDETCRVMDLSALETRMQTAGDWVPVYTPGNEPEFHMTLYLFLTGSLERRP